MVKRVQNKIDLERPSDRAHGEDFTVKTPAQGTMPGSGLTQPQPAVEVPDTDVDSQEGGEAKTAPGMDRVTVNSIDRKRILTALEPEARGQAPATPSEPPRAGDDTRPSLRSLETTQPRGAPPDKREPAIRQEPPPPDTRDTEATPLREVAPPLDRSPGADEAAEAAAKVQGKRPDETAPPRTLDPQPVPTRMRLTEPIIEDQSLAEMIRSKTPTDVGEELFSDDSTRQPTIVPEEQHEVRASPSAERLSVRRGFSLTGANVERRRATDKDANLYSRMRRRDDIFRFLENNLMEVNFAGKVFIKQGTIYSYSGKLTFWVKPQREETVPPLVIVSGTGRLLLTDRQREISVMQVNGEEVFVEPHHLLACQETLTPRYAVFEQEEPPHHSLRVLCIEGTGMIALSVATDPLVLTVQEDYPINVSSSNLIAWSGDLSPVIVNDQAIAELMLPSASSGPNVRLEGNGKVMMEKSAP